MAWPSAGDYAEAVQNLAVAFSDPDLRAGQIVTNALGLPVPRIGNFAAVFEVKDAAGGRSWAAKCFTRCRPELQARYAQIDAHLQQRRLPFMVDFRYLPEHVMVRGQRYPLLKMHWVEGLRLDEFLADCLSQPNFKSTLRMLCEMWLKLARLLAEADVAHGDLQHGNVLLVPVPGKEAYNLRLIDYDGMYVPALADTPPGEVGHPAYQHPQRLARGGYGLEVDRFSHLVIYTTLRSLIVGGQELWERYYDGDRLLLGRRDLAQPDKSRALRELWQLADPAVKQLVGHLVLAAQGDLAQTPRLDDVVLDGKVVALTAAQQQQVDELLADAALQRGRETHAAVDATVEPLVEEAVLGPLDLLTDAGEAAPAVAMPGQTFLGHSGSVTCVAFSPDGRHVLTGSSDRTAILWDAVTGARLRTFQPHMADVRSAAFSPDGRFVVTGAWDGTGTLWGTDNGLKLLNFQGHTASISAVAFSPDGRRVLTGSDDTRAILWDAKTGRELRNFEEHAQSVTGVAFSPDGRRVLTGSTDTTAMLWDATTGQVLHRFEDHWGAVWCVAFRADGQQIVTGGDDTTAMVWDARSGQKLRTLEGHVGDVRSVAFSRDGRQILTGSWDRSAILWDAATGREILRLQKHNAAVTSVAFHPDGIRVLTGSWDRTAIEWKVEAGDALSTDPWAAADGQSPDVVLGPPPEVAPPPGIAARIAASLRGLQPRRVAQVAVQGTAAVVRKTDDALRRAAGEENVILHQFLRVATPLAVLAVVALMTGLSVSSVRRWQAAAQVQRTERERLNQRLRTVQQAAANAQQAVIAAFPPPLESAAYQRGVQLLQQAQAAIEEEELEQADRLLGEAGQSFADAGDEAASRQELTQAQQAWSAALAAADRDLLEQHASSAFAAARQKAAAADTQATSGQTEDAVTGYRGAVELLTQAGTAANAAREQALQTLSIDLEAAFQRRDQTAAADLLARLAKANPQDSQLASLHNRFDTLWPAPKIAPAPSPAPAPPGFPPAAMIAEKPAPPVPPEPKKSVVPPRKMLADFPAVVTLPDVKTSDSQVLGAMYATEDNPCSLTLSGGDAVAKSDDLVLQALAVNEWEVVVRTRRGGAGPTIASLTLDSDSNLTFQWQPEAKSQEAAGLLQNCVLNLRDGQNAQKLVPLREPVPGDPLTVDLEKAAEKKIWKLENVPDPAQVKVSLPAPKGIACAFDPKGPIPADKGTAWLTFSDLDNYFTVRFDTSLKVVGRRAVFEITTAPHIALNNRPTRVTAGIPLQQMAAVVAQEIIQLDVQRNRQMQASLGMGPNGFAEFSATMSQISQRQFQLKELQKKTDEFAQLMARRNNQLTCPVRLYFQADTAEVPLLHAGL